MAEKDNTIKLKKPLADGTKELVLDFDKLNGAKLLKAERLAKKDDPQMITAILSGTYLAQVAAMAAGVRYDDILALGVADFSKVTVKVQAFLGGSQTQED